MTGDDREKTNGPEETSIGAEAAAADGRPEKEGVPQAPPPDPETAWGPLPGGGFRFTDNPSTEELRAYAEWDPNIKEEVREKFLDLARRRARDEAIRDVYHRVEPEPPDLPRNETPRSREGIALALSRFVADTQEAVDHLLAFGRNRQNDIELRIRSLTAVTRTGAGAARLGETIDDLFRPIGTPRRRGTRKGSPS